MTQLTKFTHSCVRFDDGDRSLVIDPGVFGGAAAALDGARAVLITHEHPDHLDVDALAAACAADSALRVWAPAAVASQLASQAALTGRVTAVDAGQAFDAGGFAVRAFGGQHALIHPLVPLVANLGFLVDDRVYHPGDSFVVPTAAVSLLLAPVHAPWSKTSEVVDFVAAVRAERTVAIHDGLLNDLGFSVVDRLVGQLGAGYGTDYSRVAPGTQLDV